MIKQLFKLISKSETEELPEPLKPGTPAPEFSLPATLGDRLSLQDMKGKPVILVFYPADNSPVCSSQLALYNEALRLFEAYEAQVVGISTDSPTSHEGFSSSLNLSFPLLSDHDPAGEVARAYGVMNPADGKSERALFLIDGEGVIRWRYVSPRDVNPGADRILQALEDLSNSGT